MHTRMIVLLAGAVFAVATTLISLTMLVDKSSTDSFLQGSGVADVGGPFTLTDQNGTRVSEADLVGKPSVLFFGFTFCPDVCPTTLYIMSSLIDKLGSDADEMNWVFISVDWERDDPEELTRYLASFDERIRGFSGTKEEIDTVTKAYKVFYEHVPAESDDYTINHTASVYLMDKDGHFVGMLGYGENTDIMLDKLKRLVAGA